MPVVDAPLMVDIAPDDWEVIQVIAVLARVAIAKAHCVEKALNLGFAGARKVWRGKRCPSAQHLWRRFPGQSSRIARVKRAITLLTRSTWISATCSGV